MRLQSCLRVCNMPLPPFQRVCHVGHRKPSLDLSCVECSNNLPVVIMVYYTAFVTFGVRGSGVVSKQAVVKKACAVSFLGDHDTTVSKVFRSEQSVALCSVDVLRVCLEFD